MDIFSWKPRGIVNHNFTTYNTRVEFMNSNEQVQQNSVNPKEIFEYTFDDTIDVIDEIVQFFNDHAKGGKLFYLIDTKGNKQLVRFANDDCKVKIVRGVVDDKFVEVGGSVTLSFRKVNGDGNKIT